MHSNAIVLPYSPWDYQLPVHTIDMRFQLIVGGRRSGKSYVAFHQLLRHALSYPNQLCWWVSPTYRDAQEIGFSFLMEIYDLLAPAIYSIHTSYMRVVFINGSVIYFKGCDKPHSLRGRGLNYVVLDESAFVHQDVWKKSLRPSLSDKKGRAILSSSPNGHNWFHEQYKYASSSYLSHGYWSCYRWPSSLSPLISAEDLDQARTELSLNDFKQEYEAEFVSAGGMVFEDFNDLNVKDNIPLDLNANSFYLSADFGYANPSAISFFCVDDFTPTVYQFDEIYKSRTSIENLIDDIKIKLNEYHLSPSNIKFVYTDPAGNADELSSGLSPVDCLRAAGFNVVNKASRINPGNALVRSYICNAHGKRRYFIHPRCKETIRSFKGYSYSLGLNGIATDIPSKDGVHDHACDSVRYFFVNKFDNSKYVADSVHQSSYLVNTRGNTIIKRCGRCRKPFLSHTPKTEPPFYCQECVTYNAINNTYA